MMSCNEYEKIRAIVVDTFSAELRDNTLDFVSFLNRNSMDFERMQGYWKNQFYWAVKWNNAYVCFILFNGIGDEKQFAPLTVWTDDSGSAWYENDLLSDELKEIAWKNVDYCVHCGACSGGTHKIIFGREFDNVCRTTMRFTNPDYQTFLLIKELVCARKCNIEGSFMNIEIKKLSPEMAEEYVHFFDVTPHDDNVDENKCYCVCWCSDDHSGDVDLSTANKRRELAKQYVKHGIIQGYAAYYGDRIVGWCNANTKSECVNCCSWLNFMQEVDVSDAEKVKSVFCFLVAPDMRGKGVAAMLLDKVCADAKADGFDYIEAYPRKPEMSGKANEYSNFQGPYKMFEQAGFAEYRKLRDKVIVRKYLK